MSLTDKYLKYKNKYLELKNITEENKNNTIDQNQFSGSNNKIFDLSKKYEYKKGELQKNLVDFEKKFGKKFKIKYNNNIIIDVVLEKAKLNLGNSFYRIIYDIPKRTTDLVPLMIYFVDPLTGENNNNTYIANIQKTDKISGSDMVQICLGINRILGADKTSLGDGTKVICDKTKETMDLSFIKLLEKNMTFYMSHGFDFDIRENTYLPYRFTDKKKLKEEISRLIKNIRNNKINEIIKEYEDTMTLLNLVIKNNDEQNLEIVLDISNPSNPNLVMYKEKPNIKELINESIDILKILYKYKNNNFLYKILVKLFRDSCDEYIILHKYLINNNRLKIIYKNKKIKRDYTKNFSYLLRYREMYPYTYEF